MYPIVFTEQPDGSYIGEFPDLPGISAEGRNLELAIADAQDALFSWLTVEFEEEDPQFPMITDLKDIVPGPNQVARNISVHYRFHVGWDE